MNALQPLPKKNESDEKEKNDKEGLDFSLLDRLTEFLYNDDEPIPILCGYFTEIMQRLL